MKLVAISTVKNEGDIIEAFVRHNLYHVSEMIIVDDDSADATFMILESLRSAGLPIHLWRHSTIGVDLLDYMTRLLHEAALQHEADWIIPLDADEFLEPPKDTSLAELLELEEPNVFNLYWKNFVWRPEEDQKPEINPVLKLRYRAGSPVHKVIAHGRFVHAGTNLRLTQGSHALLNDNKAVESKDLSRVQLCHFPVRSFSQYASKIALGYLKYLALPDWDRKLGFHYIQPFRLLTKSPGEFAAAMEVQSRRYGMPADTAEDEEPIMAPLDYKGGVLRFTNESNSALVNVLHHAETIAAQLAELHRQNVKGPTPLSTRSSTELSAFEAMPGVIFEASPNILRECDGPGVVRITWDATVSGKKTAMILVIDDAGTEQIFSFVGISGSINTGLWAKGGMTFILRDENLETQLGKLTIDTKKY